MTMVTAANAEAGPVQSTAVGIDVAYGVSAAIAAVALVLALLKVHNRRKPEQRGTASIELVPDSAVADDEVAVRLAEATPVPKTARVGETARGAQPPVAHEIPEGAAL